MGLVSSPGGIVLWDEWHAALNKREVKDDLEFLGTSEALADNQWHQPTKEVEEDRTTEE